MHLMNIQTNTYLRNGNNYQDDRLRIYLPGNGGLLSAIAMMVAGYDGINQFAWYSKKWEMESKMGRLEKNALR